MVTKRRRARVLAALAVALLSLTPAVTARGDLLTNGSFEQVPIGSPYVSANPANIPGWTHTGATGDGLLWAIGYADSGGNVTTAGDGRQFVTLGAGFDQPAAFAAWSQTLTGLTPGSSYLLTFKMSAEGTDSGTQSLTAGFTSGSSTPSRTFTEPNGANYWKNWVSESMTFVANSSSVTLQFSAFTSEDVGLDAVSVVLAPASVPEPSSLAIVVGLVILSTPYALVRRRLRRNGDAPQ